MLYKSLVSIYNGKGCQRGLFSMRLIPIIDLSREEEIIVFHYIKKKPSPAKGYSGITKIASPWL